jgi:hypothetical protein
MLYVVQGEETQTEPFGSNELRRQWYEKVIVARNCGKCTVDWELDRRDRTPRICRVVLS